MIILQSEICDSRAHVEPQTIQRTSYLIISFTERERERERERGGGKTKEQRMQIYSAKGRMLMKSRLTLAYFYMLPKFRSIL